MDYGRSKSLFLSMVLIVSLILPSGIMVNASSANLGTISHYNGLIFNDLTAMQADTEGALAVGGTAKFGSTGQGFDVGAAGADVYNGDYTFMGTYTNPNNYPTLLLGGKISSITQRLGTSGGDVVMKQSFQQQYEDLEPQIEISGGSVRYVEDNQIDQFFADTRQKVIKTANLLHKANDKVITKEELTKVGSLDTLDYENKNLNTSMKILSYTLERSAAIDIREVDFSTRMSNYDMIIITILSDKINFINGTILENGAILDTSCPRKYPANEPIKRLGEKIIWNFPNAKEVNIDGYGIIGTVLAPYATIDGVGGSINGMLIANNLIQDEGMELHAFKLAGNDKIFDIEDPDPDPTTEEPTTEEPTTEEPTTEEPTTEEPTTEEPTTEEPTTEEPTTEEPTTEEPTTEEPTTEGPTTEGPTTETPTTEEPTTEEPTTETPTTEEPTTEEPTTEGPTTETPTTEEPTTEAPTTEEPTTEKPPGPGRPNPTTEEPTTEQPTTEEPPITPPKFPKPEFPDNPTDEDAKEHGEQLAQLECPDPKPELPQRQNPKTRDSQSKWSEFLLGIIEFLKRLFKSS